MKYNCIIVDDEYLAIRILKGFAEQTGFLEPITTFNNAAEALVWMQTNKADIVLTDIQMPGLNGIEFVKLLTSKPAVIYTTARHDFALQAYELDVIDYLVKPVAFERFEKAVQKAIQFINYQQLSNTDKQQTGYLIVKADYKIIRVPHKDILFIEGLSEYVKIHTSPKSWIVLTALKTLIEELPVAEFVRIHKSYIIARNYIRSYNSTSVTSVDGKELSVGRTYKEDFLSFMKG